MTASNFVQILYLYEAVKETAESLRYQCRYSVWYMRIYIDKEVVLREQKVYDSF
jgi:hypothetical protein